MLMYTIMLLIPLMLTMFLILINYFLSKHSIQDREKPSPFECGFNPLTSSRLPFSMQFFLVGIIFLMFDIELVVLSPIIPSLMTPLPKDSWMYAINFVLMVLLIGLIYEWNEQSLIWMK